MERTQTQLALAKASIRDLERKISVAKERKNYFSKYIHELYLSFLKGKISREDYLKTEYNIIDGKTVREWITHYEDYIRDCEILLKEHQGIVIKKQLSFVFFSSIFIFIILATIFYIQPRFSGFAVQSPSVPIALNDTDLSIETIQSPAILGQPVKWIKTISLNEPKNIAITLPEGSENITVKKITESYSEQQGDLQERLSPFQGEPLVSETASFTTKSKGGFFSNIGRLTGGVIGTDSSETQVQIEDNATDYQVEYETPAPEIIFEEDIEGGKRVEISGSDSVHYENVLAFTSLDESLGVKDISQIRIHWIENDTYLNPSSITDKDNNGIYDYIEWVVPSLSTQTFEIIVITKAEHLDSNKNFISDIYDEVKEQDDIWSEPINENEYVRVTFEINLTNQNDITIYPRIVSGNPKIEVYEKDGTVLIAEFSSLISNQYNQVLLTNLQNSQDSFDLKISGGSVEFDHIIDPVISLTSPTIDSNMVPLSNNTFLLARINASKSNASANAESTLSVASIFTNGTVKQGPFLIDSAVGPNSAVDIDVINNTHFVLAWFDLHLADELRGIYSMNGTQLLGPTTTDGSDVQFYDVCVAHYGNRSAYFYTDSVEADVDLIGIWDNSTTGLPFAEINVDTNAGMTRNQTNYVDCAAINSTNVVITWVDETTAPDDVKYRVVNPFGATLAADVSIDSNVGTAVGHVATTIINDSNNKRIVLAWYDGTDQDISYAIEYANNGTDALALTDINTTAGTSSNIAVSAIANKSAMGVGADNFVVVWYSQDSNDIMAQTFDSDGNTIASAFSVESNPNTTATYKRFSVVGQNANSSFSICTDTFGVTYTNSTGASLFKTYFVNGSTWDGNGCPWRALPADSINPVSVFGTNIADNVNRSNSSVTFDLKAYDDTDIQTIQLFGNWTGSWVANYSNNSYTNNTWLNITVDAIPNGEYIWAVFSNDSAGNFNLTGTNRTFTIDTVAPVITLPFYTNGTKKTSTSDTLTLNISVSDVTTSPGACKIDINGTNQTVAVSNGWCNITNGFLTGLSDGNRTINVYANDTVNIFGVNNSFVVFVDATNPVAEFGTNLADNVNRSNSSVTFDLRGYDGISLSYLNLYGNWTGSWVVNQSNSSPINATYWNITVDNIPQGEYIWAAWANDSHNNQAFSATNRTFTIDTVAPTITLPFYTNGTLKKNTETITLNISVTDATTSPSACVVNINGTNQTIAPSSGWCNITNGFLTSLSDGNTTIFVWANDSANNFGLNSSFVVKIDSTAPVITLPFYTNGTKKTSTSDTLTLNISVSDAGTAPSACKIDINGTNQTVAVSSGWCNITDGFLTGLSDGNRTINVYANDTLNTFGINNSYVVYLDTTAPTITLPFYTNGTKKTSTSDTLILNISVSDAASTPSSCKIDINGTNQTVAVSSGWCNITDGFLTNLADGNRTINVYANDTFNIFGINNSYVVFVDATNPVAEFGTNPADNVNRSNTSVTFDLRGYDGISLSYLNLYGNWTGSWVVNQSNSSPINATYWNITVDNIPNGEYIWAAWANDSHNNQAFSATNRTFTIDTVAPTITLPFYANGTQKFNNETLTLNISVSDATTSPSSCKIDINGTNQTVAVSSGWCNITNGFLTNLAAGNRTINVYANDTVNIFGVNNSYVVDILSSNTAPTITLNYPTDNQNLSTSSITFSAIPVDAEDATGLNVSIYGNWTGSWHLNTSNTSSLNNTQTNFSISAIADGEYIWNALVVDTGSLSAFATSNFTFTKDTVAPTITLPFYVNGTKKTSTSSTLTLNISVSDATTSPSSCKIDINGTNQTVAVSSGWCNITNGFLTNLADGNRTINVYANDTVNIFGVNNSFVVFLDTTAPVTNFYSPANATSTSNLNQTFIFNQTDNIALKNSTLYVWDDTNSNIAFSGISLNESTYDNVNMTSPDATPEGIFFNSSGTKAFLVGHTGNKVMQFTLSQPWNLSTITFDNVNFSTGTEDTFPTDIQFSSNGSRMYIVGITGDSVYQYTLTSPWNLSTASYDSIFFNVTTQDNTPTDIFFRPDGTMFFMLGETSRDVFKYNLTTAWDLSTAVYSGSSYTGTGQNVAPEGFYFKSDGTKFYHVDSTADRVYEHSLSQAWNLSTASATGVTFNVQPQDGTAVDIFFNETQDKMYIVGNTGNRLYQYTVPLSSFTTAISGTSNSTSFSFNFTDTGTYLWNAQTCDVFANCAFNATNYTITLTAANTAPTIPFVEAIADQNVSEAGIRGVVFNFSVNDTDGSSNINISSVRAQFNKTGESTRSNTSCMNVSSGGNGVMFTCNISMYYFDLNGAWTINVSARDNSDASAENSTTNFTYNLLTAMMISPAALTWASPINLTDTDQGSNNDPITINNTGNAVNLSINTTAYNLRGETTTTQFIFANNFTVGNATEGCTLGIGTSTMSNATSLKINGTNLSRGNNSLLYGNETSGQEQLFFCLKGVPQDASAQSYSSSFYGPWQITVLLVALIPARRKKKKKEDNRLLEALDLIVDQIKEDSGLKGKEVTERIMDRLIDKYGVSKKEVMDLIGEKTSIPITIFSKNLGVLESLVKYMKENLKMSYIEIAKALERDERTIWTAYKKANEKQKAPLEIKETDLRIPISIFENKKLTTLEAMILYLKEKGFKFSEMAEILKRDQRNIWTIYSRAKKKIIDKR